jgi:hypothetical protein
MAEVGNKKRLTIVKERAIIERLISGTELLLTIINLTHKVAKGNNVSARKYALGKFLSIPIYLYSVNRKIELFHNSKAPARIPKRGKITIKDITEIEGGIGTLLKTLKDLLGRVESNDADVSKKLYAIREITISLSFTLDELEALEDYLLKAIKGAENNSKKPLGILFFPLRFFRK